MKSLHPKHYNGGLIYDDSRHYIDHLAPFCALMKWPLIVCESSVAELARKYYPDLEVIESHLWDVKLPRNLVSCDPILQLRQVFPPDQLVSQTFFWLPHGNSDKNVFFEGLLQKEIALVYGQRMIDFMQSKKALPAHICIGNFRYHYFKQHQPFYDELVKEYRGAQNILYAPTWDDAEKNNSFWNCFPALAKSLKSDERLIVKVHPNTAAKFAPELEIIKGKYERENILFLEDFPPIYPLLEISSAYIGDTSSIGYDFLTFNRPMFFLDSKNLPLFSCGKKIKAEDWLYEPQESLFLQRQKVYESTFDSIEKWEKIAERIEEK